jgi:uncharacterized protein (TIGR02391 family)
MPILRTSLVPDAATLLELEVEELAGVLLTVLNSYRDGESEVMQRRQINQGRFFRGLERNPQYPSHQQEVNRALMEAWTWLQGESFLIREPPETSDWFFVSRRGKRMKSQDDLAAYRKANLLPKGQLHPFIASEVYPAFLRGKYDTAIFEAFREVEVVVREAGKFGPNEYATELMRDAFRPADKKGQAVMPGPLTDTQLPIAEQEAMANLFAGAIGLYKNPQSHRHVPTRPEDAAEVIVFARQLLRIVDRLKPDHETQRLTTVIILSLPRTHRGIAYENSEGAEWSRLSFGDNNIPYRLAKGRYIRFRLRHFAHCAFTEAGGPRRRRGGAMASGMTLLVPEPLRANKQNPEPNRTQTPRARLRNDSTGCVLSSRARYDREV